MCGRFALHSPMGKVAERTGIEVQLEHWSPRYNVAPGTHPPSVNGRSGKPVVEQCLWGFKPGWAASDAPRPINARAEKVAKSPYFRDAFRHCRCLIPADGWFEWKVTGAGKVPHYITHKEGDLLCFAGVYDPGGESHSPSFAIITQPAAGALRDIHDRMPVVLTQGSYRAWLDPELSDAAQIKSVTRPLPVDDLLAHPVSTAVNRVTNDYPELLDQIACNAG